MRTTELWAGAPKPMNRNTFFDLGSPSSRGLNFYTEPLWASQKQQFFLNKSTSYVGRDELEPNLASCLVGHCSWNWKCEEKWTSAIAMHSCSKRLTDRSVHPLLL
jgi:hypothetical protein